MGDWFLCKLTIQRKLVANLVTNPKTTSGETDFIGNNICQKPAGICSMEQDCYISGNWSRSIQAETAGPIDDCLGLEGVETALDEMRFRVRDFWKGYKLYCFGHYSQCLVSKEQFLASKMGRVVYLVHKEKGLLWGSKFDGTVRQVWAIMEEYLKVHYGKDCTNLRALMEEFEDCKELSTTENGSLLLQLIKDDEYGTESRYKRTRNVQIRSTNIFDQFRKRLNQVDSNLGNLMKSSELRSHNSVGEKPCGSRSVRDAAKSSELRSHNSVGEKPCGSRSVRDAAKSSELRSHNSVGEKPCGSRSVRDAAKSSELRSHNSVGEKYCGSRSVGGAAKSSELRNYNFVGEKSCGSTSVGGAAKSSESRNHNSVGEKYCGSRSVGGAAKSSESRNHNSVGEKYCGSRSVGGAAKSFVSRNHNSVGEKYCGSRSVGIAAKYSFDSKDKS